MNRPLKDIPYYIVDLKTGQRIVDQDCEVIESKPLRDDRLVFLTKGMYKAKSGIIKKGIQLNSRAIALKSDLP